jgi:hypothetical protein
LYTFFHFIIADSSVVSDTLIDILWMRIINSIRLLSFESFSPLINFPLVHEVTATFFRVANVTFEIN